MTAPGLLGIGGLASHVTRVGESRDGFLGHVTAQGLPDMTGLGSRDCPEDFRVCGSHDRFACHVATPGTFRV